MSEWCSCARVVCNIFIRPERKRGGKFWGTIDLFGILLCVANVKEKPAEFLLVFYHSDLVKKSLTVG